MPGSTNVTRRTLIVAGLVLPSGLAHAAEGAPPTRNLSFEIWRAGSHIGEHNVSFQTNGGETIATIAAKLVVKIGPVPVFHYSHSGKEVWRDGRFASFEGETSNNGHVQRCSATRTADGVTVTNTDGRTVAAPADLHPLTHWNQATLKGPLFNPQTGVLVKERVVVEPGQSVKLADGRSIVATRYTLAGGADIVDYYDADGVWAGLHGKVQDGSFIDYRRL